MLGRQRGGRGGALATIVEKLVELAGMLGLMVMEGMVVRRVMVVVVAVLMLLLVVMGIEVRVVMLMIREERMVCVLRMVRVKGGGRRGWGRERERGGNHARVLVRSPWIGRHSRESRSRLQ